MKRVHTDRSRTESYQRCKRLRYHEYHHGGTGIVSSRKPLPLAVGGSVHAGLAYLVHAGQVIIRASEHDRSDWLSMEDKAVDIALQDFARYSAALEPPDAERIAQEKVATPSEEFGAYLAAEQASLVEAIVRAYSRRRLRPLLEQYEVLEVEREGEWELSRWINHIQPDCANDNDGCEEMELRFMSRPDALLRDRESNELYILSYKTAASWDVRKERDAQHDMQGLSEGVEVERRLAEWWDSINHEVPWTDAGRNVDESKIPPAIFTFLSDLPAPPRILGIRYEYMLKGERWKDKELSARFGFEARHQRSHLVRGYLNSGMAAGDEQWNWAWDYLKPDGSGETSKLNYRAWHSEPIWTHMPVKRWIDMLDESAPQVNAETGQDMGYSGPGQATGTTTKHPLDEVFLPEMIVYRNLDDLRDWIESTEYQEREIAEHVAQVEAATDEDEKRSLLNRYFPMTRRACSYPTECFCTKLCYGGEEIRSRPLESGLYQIRVPNHPQEVSK